MPHFFDTVPVTWRTLMLNFCCVSVVKSLDNSLAQTFVNCKSLLISVDKKNQLDVTFVFVISLLLVAQHVSGNHVPIIRS